MPGRVRFWVVGEHEGHEPNPVRNRKGGYAGQLTKSDNGMNEDERVGA